MRHPILAVLGVTAMLAVAAAPGRVAVIARPSRAAEPGQLPGMCSGRSDADLRIIAHAGGGPGAVPKFILNLTTDSTGQPTGALIVYRGPRHLTVTDFCRAWQHLPGQPSGDCEEGYPPGAVTAHAVGLGSRDGRLVLVRADVRKLADGENLFRLRYRAWPPGDTALAGDSGCEDAGWTWIPGEETWAPLDQLRVSP